MPTYSYACKDCGHAFDIQQAFTDDALSTCPSCGGSLRKVFSAVGVVFKGSGFYRTDSRGSGGSGGSGAASGGKEASTPAAKTEAKPAAASAGGGSSSSSGGSSSSSTSSGGGSSSSTGPT